ncbi:30S ribosomal protein S16 [endosymbiont GvMRE of Glomus versiforme]|uniref:30S ribosomal protein S16 n=1 Tax=endosymbiont GvMRE of Glomus versiforme TaxID=2039283 RepID=UPI000EEDF737|nr:30S ribosomal protein S16 [endosymbiont GvMRE of Glomus versiforme]RHZ37593.1 30S ribosomal protein S16 [endosymbiont GvMRE of Glomus versiforme]
MVVKIRLTQRGKKHQHSYRIIAVDSRKPRDTGNYLEELGHYNSRTKEIKLDKESIQKWLSNGAQPTQTVANLIKKHL